MILSSKAPVSDFLLSSMPAPSFVIKFKKTILTSLFEEAYQ